MAFITLGPEELNVTLMEIPIIGLLQFCFTIKTSGRTRIKF